MALGAIAVTAHLVAVVTRGLAVHRAPWGNMYEFVTALTVSPPSSSCSSWSGTGPGRSACSSWARCVVALGLTETLIYTAAGQLVAALQSYWLSIHVTAMTLATGIFFVAAVLGAVYLAVDRYNRRVAAGRAVPRNGIVQRLPGIEQLDRLTYRTIVFGFPVWTFASSRARSGPTSLEPLLGLGPGGDVGLHHLGAVCRVPARQGHRWLARPACPLHPVARLRQPDVQHPARTRSGWPSRPAGPPAAGTRTAAPAA